MTIWSYISDTGFSEVYFYCEGRFPVNGLISQSAYHLSCYCYAASKHV